MFSSHAHLIKRWAVLGKELVSHGAHGPAPDAACMTLLLEVLERKLSVARAVVVGEGRRTRDSGQP